MQLFFSQFLFWGQFQFSPAQESTSVGLTSLEPGRIKMGPAQPGSKNIGFYPPLLVQVSLLLKLDDPDTPLFLSPQ